MFNYTAPLAPELSHRTDNSYYIDNFEAQKKLIKLGYGLGSYTLQEYNYIFKMVDNESLCKQLNPSSNQYKISPHSGPLNPNKAPS